MTVGDHVTRKKQNDWAVKFGGRKTGAQLMVVS